MKIPTREEILSHFDERQRNLYKRFPSGHILSKKENCENFIMLLTYYRRNRHRFAEEYLGLKLHWYQKVQLFFMGILRKVVIIASRATAKSYITGVNDVCECILYPHSLIGITAHRKDQSQAIISKKIIGELMNQSPRLRNEIESWSTSDAHPYVKFKNGSEIFTVTLGKRGDRTTMVVGEEAREIKKSLYDEAMSPTQFVRPVPFRSDPYYSVTESPERYALTMDQSTEILISSSIEDTHWLYKAAKDTALGYIKGEDVCFFALDYAVSLQCGIKSKKQLLDDKRKFDPVTWLVEYENAVLRSNTKAYFDYDEVRAAQVVQKAFFPRKADDVINRKPNPYSIPKQKDEIRIISCDIAMVDRKANDNSCYSCLRMIPEADIYGQKTFKVQVPYLEAMKGFEIRKQAIRIRQLFNDFDADYIVLDVRNGGVSIVDILVKTLYDDERCIEYPPIKVMNDEALNRACTSSSALPVIYAISASSKFNSNIAVNFKSMLGEGRVQLLVPKDDGIEEIRKFVPEYNKTDDPDVQLFYEQPYLQTMLLFSELINLEYTKNDLGDIRIYERPSLTKDRYVSLAYGCWFVVELARDMLAEEEIDFSNFVSCVSNINF